MALRFVFGKPVQFPFDLEALALASNEIDPQWVVVETRLPRDRASDWSHEPEGHDSTFRLGGWRDRSDVFVALPGGLRFLIFPDQRTISYEIPRAAPLDLLKRTLISNVVPIALALTGELVLHASIVGDARSCIAFAGTSGAGKSTLAAYLSDVRGLDFLADDGALVEWREDVPYLTPSHRGLRLWPDSLRELFPAIDPSDVMDSSEKCTVSMPELTAPATTRLARLFILAASPDGDPPSIEVPSLKDAMLGLAESVFRGNLYARDLLAREFRSLERLVSTGIVRVLRYSKRYDDLPKIADLIEQNSCALPGDGIDRLEPQVSREPLASGHHEHGESVKI